MTTATMTHGWAEDAGGDIQMTLGWRFIDPSGVAVVAGEAEAEAEAEMTAGTTIEARPIHGPV
jgi:hypothetical protein